MNLHRRVVLGFGIGATVCLSACSSDSLAPAPQEDAGPVCASLASYPSVTSLPDIAAMPDPFQLVGGKRITSPAEWACRHDELKLYIQHYEYGALPPPPTKVTGQLGSDGTLTVNVSANGKQASFTASVSLPSGSGPFPAFIHISSGEAVAKASDFTSRGYAFIFLDTASVAADAPGRQGLFYTLYPDAEAGVLMAWAWGVHRIVDVLSTMSQFDAKKLAVNGFSRWGKGALVAGAFDERIALTVPSSSGLSGSGQFRFFYEDPSVPDTANEKIENAWGASPYWYTHRFGEFVADVTRLPFDQHETMALVAPRALILTQGHYDYWTNPHGTSMSIRAAETVFDYLGIPDNVGVAWDEVAHELTAKHVQYILDFADMHFKNAHPTEDFHAMPDDLTDDPKTHPWSAP